MKPEYYLLYSTSDESRKVCQTRMGYNVPCEFLHSSDAEEKGPILISLNPLGPTYTGLEEILEYFDLLKNIN